MALVFFFPNERNLSKSEVLKQLFPIVAVILVATSGSPYSVFKNVEEATTAHNSFLTSCFLA
jgi:hypothetical protein